MPNLSEIKIMSQANFEALSALNESKLYFVEAGAVVQETVVSGTSGYIVFTDGACIQWGYISSASTSGTAVTLTKTYANTNYLALATAVSTSKVNYPTFTSNTSGSSVKIGVYTASPVRWLTIGQLAQGQY